MKIGILSDTHQKLGRAKKVISIFVEKKCDYILHAGDIVRKEILDLLEEIGIPYACVLGNNDAHLAKYMDSYNLYQEPYFLNIEDTSIKIMHHPYYLFPQDSDIAVYGHTHTQLCEQGSKTLFLNSGEVCARDGDHSQAMILKIKEKKYIIQQYQRHTDSDEWVVNQEVFNKK